MGAGAASGRRYAGASAGERRAGRRERLIRAAVALYGERGYRRTTVSEVCRAAGLTPRYFYEAFDNSRSLLAATFREVAGVVARQVAVAAEEAGGDPESRLRALLTAYYRLLHDDPARARFFLSGTAGVDAAVDALFARSLDHFADRVARALDPDHVDGTIDPLRRAGAMHGLLAVARAWVEGGCIEPVDHVVRTAQPLCRMLIAKGDATPSPSDVPPACAR